MKWWELVLITLLCGLAAWADTSYTPSNKASGYLPPPSGSSRPTISPNNEATIAPEPEIGCQLPFVLPCELG